MIRYSAPPTIDEGYFIRRALAPKKAGLIRRAASGVATAAGSAARAPSAVVKQGAAAAGRVGKAAKLKPISQSPVLNRIKSALKRPQGYKDPKVAAQAGKLAKKAQAREKSASAINRLKAMGGADKAAKTGARASAYSRGAVSGISHDIGKHKKAVGIGAAALGAGLAARKLAQMRKARQERRARTI